MNIFKKFFNKKLITSKKSLLDKINVYEHYTDKVNNSKAINYYKKAYPIATGIDIIGDEFEAIKPQLYNIKSNKYENDKNIINLLNTPNADITMTEFLGEISRYYLITGDSYIMATGNINREPLELFSIPPQNVIPFASRIDPFVEKFVVISNNTTITFKKNPDEKNGLRYINSDNRELWHIKRFNSDSGQAGLEGLSMLNAIYLEIEQHYKSGKHNLSVLKNGITTSGVLSFEEDLTEDQREYVNQQLRERNIGENNAGRIFVFDRKSDFKDMGKSFKDMDFRNLRKDMELSVYNRLKIPLPLISTETQTYNNMYQAKLGLYDNAVIPLINRIYSELQRFLFYRYKLDSKIYNLIYNENDIEVLSERNMQNKERLSKINIFTTNELRNMFGYADIPGGETLYIPSNLLPLGSYTDEDSTTKKLEYKKILSRQLDSTGKRVYSDEIIDKYASLYFGNDEV